MNMLRAHPRTGLEVSSGRDSSDDQTVLGRTVKQRAAMLRRLRQFFDQRGFVEVETPLVSSEIIPELHIEPFAIEPTQSNSPSRDSTNRTAHYLQASPEADMKRLLAAGATAIYQVTRSFRAGERGPMHRSEFTIVEWYRTGDDMRAGIGLLDELSQCLLSAPPAKRTSYAEAMENHVGISPHHASCQELANRAAELSIALPAGLDRGDRDQWLNLLLAVRVEPKLGCASPEILFDYPASQAALAKIRTDEDGTQVAERFELYWHGIELANGYHELTDAGELRQRLQAVNTARKVDGRQALPLPEQLFAAMDAGLPDCAGVALGFDRLLMLACDAKSIDEVMTFGHNPIT